MPTCLDIANFFRSKQDPESGDLLTHLKLQKLVYYAQAFHLAIFKTPLFNDQIQAWDHGPVTPRLFHEYKKYKSGPIPPLEAGSADDAFTPEQIELLNEVNEVYGQFGACALRNMTHEEDPWLNAFEDGGQNTTISHEAMCDYYVRYVKEQE
ncbi:MAG: Panacea domain-containing protein [Desulfovibrionaceae bacterium]